MSAWCEWDGDILRIGPADGPALMLATHWGWRLTWYADESGWDVAFLRLNIGYWRRRPRSESSRAGSARLNE